MRQALAAGTSDYIAKSADAIELVARLRYHARAYFNRFFGDAAYTALRRSQHELMKANAELLRLVNTDALTGIANQRRVDEYLIVEWRRAIEAQSRFGLVMADVDDFKRYNDTCGQFAGDEVLRQVAAAIEGNCPHQSGLVARFGGDEFGMILPRPQEGEMLRVVERIRLSVQGLPIGCQNKVRRPVTVSIGGAICAPQAGQSVLEWLVKVDGALYEAKRAGKNRMCFLDGFQNGELLSGAVRA